MNSISLQRNVQFLYEEHLARIELESFGCKTYLRDPQNPWRYTADLNGNAHNIIQNAAYIGTVDSEPTIYGELILPAYQGGKYNRTRSVNQYLTHWIYPYRGKFHPQMVRALLNILGAKPGSLVLDPFLGSGTTALEASLIGANCIGTDQNPVSMSVTKVKTQAYRSVEAIRQRVAALLEDQVLEPDDVDILQEDDPQVQNFLLVAQLVTASDVSRRSREAGVSFRRNLANMLESVEAQARAVSTFNLSPGTVTAIEGDVRDLSKAGIQPESVDVVVTSPPYSIALDYVKNDEHALKALKVNPDALRERVIGVRGKGAQQRHAAYNEDMRRAFTEISRVLKPGARAAFVVGDATINGAEVTTTSEMEDWAALVGLRIESRIPKIVFGLYNTMQDEKILIFRKDG